MRNEVDAVASMLLRDADARREAGDIDGALLFADGADALLVLLDYEAVLRAARKS
ncbi:hypothetical protein PMNALOAF_4326 [Methylobacterium adhaesivum]|uniref:Uncharacterized protein n=1 Tax=Methylobacterium adhaesivum TaxID=333297 RepID=A0ABT8BLK7_9HYPH|nr:hypothetical protein [Methylobacterium adhaesivum]MDN3593097.1 hypothetical protein [Methylobacterium adhaesivum]GJD33045.1 hypothetical protein PMNALOAF_4326 [Methylobacterium adhaesivum]